MVKLLPSKTLHQLVALYNIMKKSLLFIVFLYLWACNGADDANILNADGLIRMMKTDSTIQLVDVRTPEELQETGWIPGAISTDYNAADFDTRIAQLNKEKPVIVYCRSGSRSSKAALEMREMGFKNVLIYSGGMNDWKKKGHETVRGGR